MINPAIETGRPKAEKFPPKCYSQIVTETPRPWDRRSTETTKAYAAFLAYIALGARRSIREALRQNSGETAVSGKLRTWEGLVFKERLGKPCERPRRMDSPHVGRSDHHQHLGLQAGAGNAGA